MLLLLVAIPLATRQTGDDGQRAKTLGEPPIVQEWVPTWDLGPVTTAQSKA